MKYVLMMLAVTIFASCGSGTGETAASDSANATQNLINTGASVLTDSAESNSGARLIAANDCLTCHQVNKKSTGPSYMQIANKYDLNEGNIENLATAVMKGSKGLWGNAEMTPHPALSFDEAKTMCRYILSLRNSVDTTK